MKKIRIASLLLVLVLATSCFVGTTFAKYTTTAGNNDSARVAEWGVDITYTPAGVQDEVGDGFDLEYASDADPAADGISIAVSAETNVVAPGTEGSFGTFVVDGKPEVATKVTKNITVTIEGWNVTPDAEDDNYDALVARADGTGKVFYCPITFSIDGNTVNGLNYESADLFVAAIVEAYQGDNGGAEKNYQANADLSGLTIDGFTWAWEFDEATGSAINQMDAYDTQLGNLFEDGAAAPTIAINYSLLVDQIN